MKKAMILIILLIVGFFTSKTISDNAIKKGINNLENYGIECKITKDSGLFTQTREFDLKIVDGKKFITNSLDAYGDTFKQFKSMIASLNKKINNEKVSKTFENFLFKGFIANSNINPFADVDVNLYLAEVKNQDDFLPKQLIDKKLINFDMIVSKSGNLKSLTMKDIDERFSDNGEGLDTKIIGFHIKNRSSSDLIMGDMDIKNIGLTTMKNSKNTFSANLDDLNYNIEYKDQFNNKGTFSFENLSIGDGKKEHIDFGKSFIYGDIVSKGDKLDLSVKTGITNIQADLGSTQGGLKKSNLDIKISDLDLNVYKKINELNMEMVTKSMDAKTPEELDEVSRLDEKSFELLKELASKGLKANIKFDIQDFNASIVDLKHIDLVANFTLKPTDKATLSTPASIKSIDLTADLTMTKEDYEVIKKGAPQNFAKIAGQFVNIKGDKAILNLIVKDGNVSVNGKQIM